MKMKDKVFVFCDVYHFTSTKENMIKELYSYPIESNLQGY